MGMSQSTPCVDTADNSCLLLYRHMLEAAVIICSVATKGSLLCILMLLRFCVVGCAQYVWVT